MIKIPFLRGDSIMRTAKKLTVLMERLATDEKFKARVKMDPERTLEEMGWEPQELVSFAVRQKLGCGSTCGCDANMGQGCGTKSGNIVQCPTGRPGQVY